MRSQGQHKKNKVRQLVLLITTLVCQSFVHCNLPLHARGLSTRDTKISKCTKFNVGGMALFHPRGEWRMYCGFLSSVVKVTSTDFIYAHLSSICCRHHVKSLALLPVQCVRHKTRHLLHALQSSKVTNLCNLGGWQKSSIVVRQEVGQMMLGTVVDMKVMCYKNTRSRHTICLLNQQPLRLHIISPRASESVFSLHVGHHSCGGKCEVNFKICIFFSI